MRAMIASIILMLMAGAATAQPANDPLWRTLTWFNYIAGDDVREACTAGGPDRYRFVYNGPYYQQIRGYDFDDYSAVLNAFAVSPAPMAEYLSELFPQFGESGRSTAPVGEAAREALLAGLEGAGFSEPPPAGAWLESDHHYWVVTACIDGQFRFNAWTARGSAQSEALAHLDFIEPLLALDQTGVPMSQLRRTFPSGDGIDAAFSFRIQVGRNGLKIGRYWRQ